jgi:acyl-CoA synthetase (AMP-forming)/AMP-acid ligase II
VLDELADELAKDAKISVPFLRLPDLLKHHAGRIPDAPAVLAPDRAPLSYGRLHRHVETIGHELRSMGIGPQDRVVAMLPNGLDLAVAIVGVASHAACAVVNTAYAAEELERYFADLRPRAVIIPAGADMPARRVALAGGITVIDLAPASDAEAGRFTLSTATPAAPSREPPGPGDVALLLLTSGTTSRPKIVPLTHANICTSAYSAVAALALTENDRCLNVLPLFHGHGLIATVLTSLAAGASVVCTAGIDVGKFFAWIKTFQPTWYSAVPTMHQAILARARQNPELVEGCRLRLVRSASAPLPPRVFAELERTFATVVIEFYGMTETASAPIACNPLPPGRRKAGSVGIPVGLDVAIMNERGTMRSGSETGEVVVRGGSVMPGYDGDAAATQAAFVRGWFKTGDRGFFDADGYLFLSGRSREMINRGGENIAPREIDEALLEHPAIAEAVTFAVPHPTLGEDVAAAVVLRPDAAAAPKEIRQFAGERLAEFKVPRRVLIVKELPKGPTGKVQRVGLAAKLGLTGDAASAQIYVAPRTPLENVLAGIWADVLQREQVGIHDDFFALGGDSLLAAQALIGIHDKMQLQVGAAALFDAPTVAEMADHIETLIKADQTRPASSGIAPAGRDNGVAPASPAQERLWKLQQALPDMPFFNILYALRLTSPIDRAVLERCFNAIVARHEILRTTFAVAGSRHVQLIAPDLTVPLRFDDLRKLAKSKRERAQLSILKDELLHNFDLARGPLIRTRLIGLAADEYLLLITLHQIVIDGWSLGVLADALAGLYASFAAGKAAALPPLAIQYADFAAWQRQWRSHPEVAAQLTYWRDQLYEPLPALSLAKARRKKSFELHLSAQRDVALPASLTDTLKEFSHRDGGTLFMALVAGLKILLHRYLGEADLRVATNVANRSRAGTEGLIGPLVNTVILRTDLGGDPTPRDVLRRVRETTLAAYAHQDLPFEALADALERERGLDPVRLAPVMLLLHNASLRPMTGAGPALAFEDANPDMPQPVVTSTSFDVILVLRESAGRLAGCCLYKPHLFGARSVERLLRDFRGILKQMVTQPERPISAIRFSPRRTIKR